MSVMNSGGLYGGAFAHFAQGEVSPEKNWLDQATVNGLGFRPKYLFAFEDVSFDNTSNSIDVYGAAREVDGEFCLFAQNGPGSYKCKIESFTDDGFVIYLQDNLMCYYFAFG